MRRSTMHSTLAGATVALLLAVAAVAAPPKPKISAQEAEAAAVKKLGGKATSSKYEFEDGRWQYAVIVKNDKGMYEAEVNATTGKVMDSEKTSEAEEAKEAAADAKKAADGGVKKAHSGHAAHKSTASTAKTEALKQ